MAAVSVSPLPQSHFPMSNRRVPLASVPNAANSPYRHPGAAAVKRPRSYAQDQREAEYGQQPPAKKQILDFNSNGSRRVHQIPATEAEGRVFAGSINNAEKNDFQKRLAAAQTQQADSRRQQPSKTEKKSQEDVETLEQWRRHYQKVFPTFVFYFESIPQDTCIRCSRQISALHAREEKFFSRAVTHVVTTRQIPQTAPDANQAEAASAKPSARESHHSQVRTINPSLLDKSADAQLNSLQRKLRPAVHVSPQKKPLQSHNNDVLHKARDLGIKIWALEKFERMMATMFDPHTSDEGADIRHHSKASLAPSKRAGDADLSQLLRNEKLNANVEKAAISEMIPLKGYYIYIHDMDEKTRPVMVREYGKPTKDQDGEWPQFRSVSNGRCPFVEEFESDRRDEKRERERRIQKDAQEQQAQAPRTRSAAAAIEAARDNPTTESQKKEPLREVDNNAKSMPKPSMPAPTSKTFEPPKMKTGASGSFDSMPPMLGSTRANYRGLVGKPGGEPVASGVQPSHVTSAIRSQMISSTAAAPGARIGMSKEVHHLQRKALERHSNLSAGSVGSSYMNEVRAAINNEQATAPRRATRQRATESLARIQEDDATTDVEHDSQSAPTEGSRAPKKKKPAKRNLKPGYCENCRDKYEDFNEHILSRKHRKFANTPDNWTDLDKLLSQLVRPRKRDPQT